MSKKVFDLSTAVKDVAAEMSRAGDVSGSRREIHAIDEQLRGGDLTPAARAVLTARRKRVHLALHHQEQQDADAMGTAEDWFEGCMRRAAHVGKFAEFFMITPPMAKVLLARNPQNRDLVQAQLSRWSDALIKDHWEVNGETIIVSDTGELNDGQHRLEAVVRTGIPMTSLIVFGVTRNSRKTTDLGAKKTPGHVLAMSSRPPSDTTITSAALRIIINIEQGTHIGAFRSPKEIEGALERHGEFTASSTAGRKVAKVLGQPSLFSALHYLMSQKSAPQADYFFEVMASGLAESEDHWAVKVRNRLLQEMKAKTKLPAIEIAALVIKAWNNTRVEKKEKPQFLVWRSRGAHAEAFPEIQ